MEEKLTKDEKKAIRKLEWEKEAKKQKRDTLIKKYAVWVGGLTVLIVAIVGMFWLVTAPTPSSNQDIKIAPVSSRDLFTVGHKNSKVTLIEYADFQCSACAVYHPIVNQVLKNYSDKIFYVFRMFPLRNTHSHAIISAQAAYAAYKQDRFFQYGDILFEKQNEWAPLDDINTAFTDYAKILNLNSDKFKAEMNSSEAKKFVETAEKQALNENLTYTPSFFINGKLIQNPNDYNGFKKLLDDALAEAK
jgi:protein-disulfide isomerase